MTTHPHLEGLMRKWRERARYHDAAAEQEGLSEAQQQWRNGMSEMAYDCANDLEALAALPGGGVDEAMVDRMIARYVELEPSEVENATKDHPATRAFCRELLTAALSPTPNTHEADRNG